MCLPRKRDHVCVPYNYIDSREVRVDDDGDGVAKSGQDKNAAARTFCLKSCEEMLSLPALACLQPKCDLHTFQGWGISRDKATGIWIILEFCHQRGRIRTLLSWQLMSGCFWVPGGWKTWGTDVTQDTCPRKWSAVSFKGNDMNLTAWSKPTNKSSNQQQECYLPNVPLHSSTRFMNQKKAELCLLALVSTEDKHTMQFHVVETLQPNTLPHVVCPRHQVQPVGSMMTLSR